MAPSPLRNDQQLLFPKLNAYGHSPYVISSLTRGGVCCLEFLLGLASTVIPESCGTCDHILQSQIRESPNL
jgi:hypothetical protein